MTEVEMLDALLKREVLISVGEPWDFVSEYGNNVLKGTIVLVSTHGSFEWVACDVSAFYMGTNKITRVIAVHRYSKQKFRYLLRGDSVVANFLYEANGKVLNEEQISLLLDSRVGLDFIVGSIRLF